MSPAPEDENLRALGARLDEVRRHKAGAERQAGPPSAASIAYRFATELVVALIVGGGIGWGLDYLLHTRPVFLILFFIAGAVAGIRNVMSAAKQLNEQQAEAAHLPSVPDDEDE